MKSLIKELQQVLTESTGLKKGDTVYNVYTSKDFGSINEGQFSIVFFITEHSEALLWAKENVRYNNADAVYIRECELLTDRIAQVEDIMPYIEEESAFESVWNEDYFHVGTWEDKARHLISRIKRNWDAIEFTRHHDDIENMVMVFDVDKNVKLLKEPYKYNGLRDI